VTGDRPAARIAITGERPAHDAPYPGAVTTETDAARWVDVLAGSHDRICDLVSELDADGLRRPSYCPDWTIAQVLSHLGSGAEIFKRMLDAGVAGEPAPDREIMQPIWDRWNALRPEEQAEEFLSTDGQLVETLENLGNRLDELTFTFFGSMQLDAVGMLGMRLSEHAVHTWDVAAGLDPSATVDPEAVSLLVDRLPSMAARVGRSEGAPGGLSVTVVTSGPERRFNLTVDDGVHLAVLDDAAADDAAGSSTETVLRLPAEAFLRLVYGRLDEAHAPPLDSESAQVVEVLRPLFTGF
jgi:uncharacterized protein (TIGR03083 family)